MNPSPESKSAFDQRSASPSEPRVIEVAAGLVFRDSKLLITQRRADSHLGGLWEFPGGKREMHETFQECLHRELREELACDVAVGALFESIVHPYPEKTVRLEFFLCRWVAGEPQPIECADLKWVDRQELAQYEFPAADARLIERLEAGEGGW